MRWKSWSREVLALLMPAGCVACKAWIPDGPGASLVCARCRSRLRSAPWPRCPRCHHPCGTGRAHQQDCLECRAWPPELRAARYAYVLAPPADDLVHALKYEGWRELARPMGDAVAGLDLPTASEGERRLVVPVPTTERRLRRRGYNQAELLAGRVAEVCALPIYRALRRRPGGRSQTSLAPAERRDNVRGVFAPAERAARLVDEAHVVLVDDVLTTGATASEAAATLTGMGAQSVSLVAFGRALASASGARA